MILLLLAACRPVDIVPVGDSAPTVDSAPVDSPADSPRDTSTTVIPGDDTSAPVGIPSVQPRFSPDHGLYDAAFDLVLSSDLDDATIRYTLDGTDPRTSTSAVYDAPLPVATTTLVRAVLERDGVYLDAPLTRSYLFPADVPSQAAPDGYPTTWWTWYADGGFPADYGMDPEIYDDPAYADSFPSVFRTLPTLSVVMDPADLFGDTGIYEHPLDTGDAWERPVSLEWLPNAAEPDWQVDAGIRIHGGASRDPACSAKKTFRVGFESEYGPTLLDEPLFPDAGVDAFDDLILRAGYNLTWIHWSATQRSQAQFRREDLARALHADMGRLAPHERVAFLYLNGLFWGLYVVHERVDASFTSRYLGGAKEEWDVINTGAPVDGTMDAWQDLMKLADAGVSTPDTYAALLAMLDVDNFIDYYLLNLYLANDDWPYNNWVAARKRVDGEKWTFYLWDTEHILEDVSTNMIDTDSRGTPGRLFQRLRENEEFRVRFGDHVQTFLFDGGALTEDAVQRHWSDLGDVVTPAVVAESARWGDYRRDVYAYSEGPYELYTVNDHYLPEDERLKTEWFPERGGVFLDQLRDADLYPAILAPLCEVAETITLTSEHETWYTIDGSDPRAEGGGVADGAVAYEGAIPLEEAVTARALSGMEWSAKVGCGGGE